MSKPRPAVLLAATQLRAVGRLDWPAPPALAAPPGAAVDAARGAGPVWLGGGEPTLRPDLPARVAHAAAAGPVGLDTDGLALARPRVVAALADAGLSMVRIALHAGRADAHDWLVGLPGAARTARKALGVCAQAGLAVEATVTVTRPTMDQLPETVALLVRLGAGRVRLRRVRRRGPAASSFVTLSPRLGLLEPFLEEAIHRAADRGVAVELDGFPACAAPRAPAAAFGPPEALRAPAGLDALADALVDPPPAPGCPACPGAPRCGGAPAAYVARFGRDELDSEAGLPATRPVARPRAPGELPPPPPPRAGRAPDTRLRAARRAAALGDLGGDPLAGRAPAGAPEVVTVAFDPATPSRVLRQALVRAAQEGAPVLAVAGDLSHPDAYPLLREALRVSAPAVEIHADPAPLATWSDRQLFALRRVRRVVVPPGGASEAQDRAVDRLREAAGIQVDRNPPRK